MDVALLLFLIFLNSLFAMSEMALTASRKARLQVMVESGDSGARHAMALHEDPTKFLSVVQIGITYTNVDSDWFRVFLGVMLLIAVLFNHYVRRRVAQS